MAVSLRALLPLFALGLVTALSGCAGKEGMLDVSSVDSAIWGQEYSAQLGVVIVEKNGSLSSYDGPAAFSTSSTMPAGLTLSEAGLITGTPTEIGAYSLEIWVSGLDKIESFLDLVDIEVTAEGVDAFLGRERDQLTQLSELGQPRQLDMWVRAAGGGGPGMNAYTPNLGIYVAGPNGVAQGGWGDDERIADVDLSEVTVTTSKFQPVDEVDPSGPSYPSGHYTDGNPAYFDEATGEFVAGSDTGEMDVTFTHPVFGEHVTRLMVVPPDWCTNGYQIGNSWDGESYCE